MLLSGLHSAAIEVYGDDDSKVNRNFCWQSDTLFISVMTLKLSKGITVCINVLRNIIIIASHDPTLPRQQNLSVTLSGTSSMDSTRVIAVLPG